MTTRSSSAFAIAWPRFQAWRSRGLRTLVRDYGVRYLVVDRVHGGEPARVARLGQRVFSNPAVAIFAVGPSASRT
jgi:hypothetical protein